MSVRVETLVAMVLAATAAIAVSATTVRAQDAKDNFKTFCVKCHGPQGKGDGPAAATLSTKPRDLTDCARMAKISDDTEFKVIKEGGAASGLSKDMPTFRDGFEDADIKALIAYVRGFCGK